ncbi:SRPBCC family protein [Rhodococcus sp. NPDC058505]|uniref:SRPBCC family protein n=1 Tax=unclassified Rhodococcus (in: high G+C Gram-positive bacteria) TaxID=192944 RepID=UPI00364F318B
MARTLRIEESITIARPLGDVFDYLSNPANATAWNSNVVDYNTQSGQPGEAGSTAAYVAKVAGLRLDGEEEVEVREANKHLRYRSTRSKIGYVRDIDFATDGTGTRVTLSQESEAGTGIFTFADSIVQKLYAHDVRGNLEKAKTILES